MSRLLLFKQQRIGMWNAPVGVGIGNPGERSWPLSALKFIACIKTHIWLGWVGDGDNLVNHIVGSRILSYLIA